MADKPSEILRPYVEHLKALILAYAAAVVGAIRLALIFYIRIASFKLNLLDYTKRKDKAIKYEIINCAFNSFYC